MKSQRVLPAAAIAALAGLITAGLAATATAQVAGRGAIAGRVVDRTTDGAVPRATVRIQGLDLRTTSDDRGEFAIADLPPGDYELTGEAVGYRPTSLAGVAVRGGETTRVTLALELETGRHEERVEVVGQLPRRSESQPGSAFTLTGTQLTTIAGTMGDFARTLRSIPAAAGTSDERNTIVARGGNPAENGFFIDNIQVPNSSHFPDWGSTGGLYSIIDPSAVRAFDFVVGGFPAKFGGFLSSITDIAYREGARDRFRGQARFDIAMAAVGAEGPLPGAIGSWRASVRHADFTVLKEIISIDNQNPKWTDAHTKVVFNLSPRHSMSVLGVVSRDRVTDRSVGWSERTDIDQATAGVNWRALWSNTLRSETSLSYSRYMRYRGEQYAPPEDPYNWADRRTTEWYAIRNENVWAIGSAHALQFGVQARQFSHRVGYVQPPTRPGVILLSAGPWDYRTTETAAFVSGILRPFARLQAIVGVRAEHSSAGGRTHVVPRAAASFTLLDWLHVNGTAAIVHQSLPADFLAVAPDYVSLRDMQAVQYSIGVSISARTGWRATVDAYNKDYSDLPVDPAVSHRLILDREPFRDYGIPTSLTSDGSGRSRGVELLIEHRGKHLTGIVSGRVSRDRYVDRNGVEHNRLYDSRYGVSLAADWAPSDRWNLSSTLGIQGGTPYTPTNVAASIALGRWARSGSLYNTVRYPAYGTLNARIERRFAIGRTTLAVFADCWNVLNRRNVGWIEGWTLQTGDIFRNQMPRTPFVGVGVLF